MLLILEFPVPGLISIIYLSGSFFIYKGLKRGFFFSYQEGSSINHVFFTTSGWGSNNIPVQAVLISFSHKIWLGFNSGGACFYNSVTSPKTNLNTTIRYCASEQISIIKLLASELSKGKRKLKQNWSCSVIQNLITKEKFPIMYVLKF